jgi:DNA polymerase I-like protein with 3'-5' exonuclease and polymerase domains
MMSTAWLQTPLWEPPITWTAPNLATLPSWRDAKRICLDVECRDDDLHKLGPGVRRGGYVCGIAFAIENGPSTYLPVAHEGGGNLPTDAVWAYLRDQARAFTGDAVFNSAPYDLDYLWQNDVPIGLRRVLDVQNAEPVIDELQYNYNLDAICARRGLPGKDERILREHAKAWGVDPKKGLWRLHAGAVGAYAERDVRAPLALLRAQEKEIDELGLRATFELESRVTPALVRMTRRGLRIDLDEMDRVEAWAKERRQSYIDQIHHLTGIRIGSLAKARELYPALKKCGLHVPTPIHAGTGKATPSITKLWLQQQDHPVAVAIISGREFDKLLGTYVNGFRKHLIGDRLHPSFKQMASASDDDKDEDDAEGARFGRCSAKHPNVQAQMKRSKEIQKRWRKVIVGDDGKPLVSADYSQQEPRWTIHYAEECRLPGARQAGNTLRGEPLYDSYQMLVDLVKSEKDTDLKKLRDDLKEVYLGRCYGMGGGKMAKKLKLPTVEKMNDRTGKPYDAAGPEAQAIIDRFDKAVPYVRALARMCTRAGKEKKYIRGYDGRRIHFELDANGEIMEEHKGLNKLIQYGAAWQTKTALVALDQEGFPLQLTVHDEFDLTSESDAEARRLAEVMCSVVTLRVPSRVDVKRGSSYGDLSTLFTVTSNDLVKEAA